MESQTITGQKTRRGFNLIESAIVLGVVGAIIGGIWVAASSMYENYKVNKTVEDVITIARNAQGLISVKDALSIGNVVNITPTLKKAGVIPKDWMKATSPATHVIHPFGGLSHMNNMASVHNPRIEIWLNEISKAVCPQLVTKISAIGAGAGSNQNNSVLASRPSLSIVAIYPASDIYTAFPISLEDAVASCISDSNNLTFVYSYTRIN